MPPFLSLFFPSPGKPIFQWISHVFPIRYLHVTKIANPQPPSPLPKRCMLNLDNITNISHSWEAGCWPAYGLWVYDRGKSKWSIKIHMRWKEPETWKKVLNWMGLAYERMNDKKAKMKEDGGIGWALPLDNLSSLCSCSMGIVMQVVWMLWRLVMLQVWRGKGEFYASRKMGNWGTGT